MNTKLFIPAIVGLVACTLSVSSCCTSGNTGIDEASVVLNNIMTRTSIRSFEDRAVEPELIETLLKAAMAAPTAANRQPWEFYVVCDRDIIAQIPRSGNTPVYIIVCGNMDRTLDGDARDFWVEDASAATENILLAAHALGLGAVWTGVYPDLNRCSEYSRLLDIPENILPMSAIKLGYPAENPEPKDKWDPEKVHYVK